MTLEHPSDVIRSARRRRGVGVRELARRAGVTPAAVSQWEESERRGTIRRSTVERALRALGTSLDEETPGSTPGRLNRREDRVTLELHRAVVHHLVDDPERVLASVPAQLERLRSRVRGAAAGATLDDWERLATGGRLGPLVDAMLGTDQRSIDLRQLSPFGGVLTPAERLAAIERAAA